MLGDVVQMGGDPAAVERLSSALRAMLDFMIRDPERYEHRNPYSRPVVKQAMKALGLTLDDM